jgi:uncharacterized protein (DUF1697 family)
MDTRLIALLRGINVGRAKRIAMADLREVLADLGYTRIKTHLQSGNAIFSCSPEAEATAAADIERAVLQRLGVQSTVILRTAEELEAAIAANPLLEVATNPSRHMVGFLTREPDAEGARTIASLDGDPDRIALVGRQVYLWTPEGLLSSPLSSVHWTPSLGGPVTMRNWNTVTKIAALAHDG